MASDKEIKEDFRKQTEKAPEKYFPVEALRQLGFSRGKCSNCGKYFWSTTDSKACGEPECEGGYSFLKDKTSPEYDFIWTWKEFSQMMSKKGYTPIQRYPVVARWNPTMEFTLASIADFQPYVVSGEIEPPANPLIVPQLCLRFNDIDNVGITGRHFTGFTMIGQHAFLPKEKFNQGQLFMDYYEWYSKGMKIKQEQLKIHEDAWAGGGNFGPCMEFFSKGLEIGNQVYMMYEQTAKGPQELKIKVLDMGMGQERPGWYLAGTPTAYEVTFPTVHKELLRQSGISQNNNILKSFIPFSGLLNFDETNNLEQTWIEIAKKIKVDVKELRASVLPMAGLFSIGDHTRALLYAIADGSIPSNVGGAYNLRILYRRMRSFMEKYSWNVDINKIIELHAKYLKPQYPELLESLDQVYKILEVEKRKYVANKQRNAQIISRVLASKVDEKKLVELYDSQGITPEEISLEAEKQGKKMQVPNNFYAKVAERHEHKEQETQTEKEAKLDLAGLPETQALYFDHYDLVDFEAVVLKIIGNNVILNETAFYPTSGGQLSDKGTINGCNVVEVFKQGPYIVHSLDKVTFRKGDKVHGKIDFERRLQLAQHHTAAHIINGVCRLLLGEHIWQAGASKTLEKGRLDITHYDNLTDEQVAQIEDRANYVVQQNLPVYKSFLERNIAEKRYGFRLYQGGAVPGKKIRIVEIQGLDVEACGGTHLDVTSECQKIRIIKTSKIQDGVIRIEYAAGKAAEQITRANNKLTDELAKLLDCKPEQIVGRVEELFEKWKKVVKKKQKMSKLELKLQSTKEFKGPILEKAAEVLRTQPEHLVKTIKRFKQEIGL